ncbi:hypothetical protein EV182_004680 [Spiromyces aspiralis]|uniref:Uncharacterized protein n=1 Tax=Spiromyces aspiralis TaxID=68401 RepID=A0ACC1HRZ8_9FUNG|nr:hypothetical protein EV182_004680 [Spiromyces aspiralis]
MADSAATDGINVHKDQYYGDRGQGSDKSNRDRQVADIYVPVALGASSSSSATRPELVVYVHGGSWRSGDKSEYTQLATRLIQLAGSRIAVAVINYTLSTKDKPDVIHPTHLVDCWLAVEWLAANGTRYGYDGEKLHLVGHSAGGHLTGLLALSPPSETVARVVRSVTGISGIYDVPGLVAKWPTYVDFVEMAFGDDQEYWRLASPQCHPLNDQDLDSISDRNRMRLAVVMTEGKPIPPLTGIRYLVAHSLGDELVDPTGQSASYHSHLIGAGFKQARLLCEDWGTHFGSLASDGLLQAVASHVLSDDS